MLKRSLLGFLLLFFSIQVFSQDISIRRTNAKITIDGIMNESAWFEADSAYNFQQYFPYDS